jgi:glycosyltransferase involved in cell wall biosynthesis
MSEQPLISVILPIYNVEKYLVDCLNSLLNQTIDYKRLEVIMVNDCSTDGSGQIVDEYARKYENFIAIHLDQNSGAPGKPRNIGIEKATGKYTIFLDPDDLLPPNAYELLYNGIIKHDSDFIMGKMTSFDDNTGAQYEHITFKNYLLQKHYYNVNINKVPFFLQVKTAVYLKLVKTEFLKKHKIKFIEGMKNGEDKYYDIQLFINAQKFSYIPKCVYLYRTRNDVNNLSMTQRSLTSTVENDVKVALIIKPLLSREQYNYFQINVFRSVLWRICDPEFNKLPVNKRKEILMSVSKVVEGYNKDIVVRYLKLEEPFLSLLERGYFDEALDYNSILISRRWWFARTKELQNVYNRNMQIRKSTSWKITRPLRKINSFLKLHFTDGPLAKNKESEITG